MPALVSGAILIGGIAGDHQAATIGQACFKPGMSKSTYGTGCFLVLNTGSEFKRSQNRLLSTIAYRINGETTYALEGSIFVAGAAVRSEERRVGKECVSPCRSRRSPAH